MSFLARWKGSRAGSTTAGTGFPNLRGSSSRTADATRGSSAPEDFATGVAASTSSNTTVDVTPPAATGSAVAAAALGAPAVEAATGLTGAGVKIGIISDSFDALGTADADEADGALPQGIDVLKDSASGNDEGRAMAEVAHGVAPGADIVFSAAGGSVAGLAAAIASLQAAGCTIICDDVTYADEPFFQMGDAAEQAISAFTAAGGAYFTAASNAGPDSSYEAKFSATAADLPGVGDVTATNFGTAAAPRATGTLNLVAGRRTAIDLQWAQPWASIDGRGTAYSLALALYDPNGNLVKVLDADQMGKDPVQSGSFTPKVSGAYTVAVYLNGGTDPGGTFKIVANDDDSQAASFAGSSGSGSIFGHNMDPEAITVGAVAARNTPAYGGKLKSEAFGSAGPGEELLSDTGVPLAAPKGLHAVDVSGPDGIATSLPSSDLDPFYGTSCATPAVAALAAVMKQADPSLDAGEIKADLKASALPFGSADQSGSGLAQAPVAVALARESNTTIHGDFFGNGQSALLWQDGKGGAQVSEVQSDAVLGTSAVASPAGPGWSAVATGDFSGAAGHSDILWQNADGRLLVETMQGARATGQTVIGDPGAAWNVVGTGDLDGDGNADIVLQDRAGDLDLLTTKGGAVASRTVLDGPGAGWTAVGIGDFDGNGGSDILWQDKAGDLAVWLMQGTSVASEMRLASDPGPGWAVVGTGDLTGDGKADILLRNAAGALDLLTMDGTVVTSQASVWGGPGGGWQAAGVGTFNGSGRDGILFENAAGGAMIADVSHGQISRTTAVATPGAGWSASLV